MGLCGTQLIHTVLERQLCGTLGVISHHVHVGLNVGGLITYWHEQCLGFVARRLLEDLQARLEVLPELLDEPQQLFMIVTHTAAEGQDATLQLVVEFLTLLDFLD